MIQKKLEDMSLEELKQQRQYLADVSLDGNNGEGDDGLENWKQCNAEIAIVDQLIAKLL